MLVFNQKFVFGVSKIKSTIKGLAFDRPCWAIMPDPLRTLDINLDLDSNCNEVQTSFVFGCNNYRE